MYHHPQPFIPTATSAHPQRGDVVLFRFPLAEEDDEPGPPKRRPCLVLDTMTKGDEHFVEIAYGTSADTRANRGYEVIVKQTAARATAGLSKPTRFVCARRIIVHVNHSGFYGRAKGPHIIGRLDEALMERMNAVRARMQAEADIAAYYREERRREEQAREGRGFQ
ncbi:type II toxin-antitoxin system PemK/MazF family toxin [Pseudooceanicola nitratireducens]|uniref:type II toxin-antitoxin system PemK/MazF family toxin n=1 Tax=Pseudooceanicola nitratireducens TaxID=517719 RepID=UPI001C98AD18|nr:type II toxin-antitoxin system PemK/MazF family toxin [Pseudooceanicola nitratireducens]MBY6155931.1 type II toxin-antitoxin system PemK/MazF family toxin [Pseudooceanicola nitratireducens]